MLITIYHILFDEMLVAETGIKEKIEPTIEKLIQEYQVENKALKKELEELEEDFKDVYGPRKKDTAETYVEFIWENYPDLYKKFCKLGRKIFREYHVRGEIFYSNECYFWNAIDSKGKTYNLDPNYAKASLMLQVSRKRFTVKEVEIEIP